MRVGVGKKEEKECGRSTEGKKRNLKRHCLNFPYVRKDEEMNIF